MAWHSGGSVCPGRVSRHDQVKTKTWFGMLQELRHTTTSQLPYSWCRMMGFLVIFFQLQAATPDSWFYCDACNTFNAHVLSRKAAHWCNNRKYRKTRCAMCGTVPTLGRCVHTFSFWRQECCSVLWCQQAPLAQNSIDLL